MPPTLPGKSVVVWLAFAVALTAASFWFLRASPPKGDAVTLVTSVDEPIYQPIVSRFTRETGVEVRVIGDTEATKATGLISRVLSQDAKQTRGVWWSSEPLGVFALKKAGRIHPQSPSETDAAWPEPYRDADRTWHAFAIRARVIAYHTGRLKPEAAPKNLRDLADPRFKNAVGMARPMFGTTRVQMAHLVASQGEDAVRAWLDALSANGLRLYDGNSAVVAAIANGEITVGLTDTDDVWSAKRNAWPVDMVFEQLDAAPPPAGSLASQGPLAIPNTVAMLSMNPTQNELRLFRFILSAPVEEALAASDSKNFPVRPEVAAMFPGLAIPSPAPVDWAKVSAALERADALVSETLRARGLR